MSRCAYCGRKVSLEKDFCIPQDSIYVCKNCYEWGQKVDKYKRFYNKVKEIMYMDAYDASCYVGIRDLYYLLKNDLITLLKSFENKGDKNGN